MKYYNDDTIIDFGKHKNEKILDILKTEPNYVLWCFETIDGFIISDELFFKLPFDHSNQDQINDILVNKKSSNEVRNENYQMLLIHHNLKKEKYIKFLSQIKERENFENHYSHSNWLVEASGTDDYETMNDVYWNLD
jgi:hypothetical protein